MGHYQVLVWIGVEADNSDDAHRKAHAAAFGAGGAYSVTGAGIDAKEAGKPFPVVTVTDRDVSDIED